MLILRSILYLMVIIINFLQNSINGNRKANIRISLTLEAELKKDLKSNNGFQQEKIDIRCSQTQDPFFESIFKNSYFLYLHNKIDIY
jgi:hypothetical protein